MLAEKFFLMLETLIKFTTPPATYPDGAPKVVSQSQFVPMKLPDNAK